MSLGHFSLIGRFRYPESYVLIPSTIANAARYWRNTIGAWVVKDTG